MRRFHIYPLIALIVMLSVSAFTASAQSSVGTVTGATALNARMAPNTSSGVVAVLPSGASYVTTGRLADNSWYQIVLPPGNGFAWVYGQYFTVANSYTLPVVASPGTLPSTSATATITAYYLNVRAIPNPYSGAIVSTISRGTVYGVVGKSATSPVWFNIQLPDGRTGWINGNYANVTNPSIVPITYNDGTSTPAQPAFGTVTAYFLNVRSTPNPYIYNIVSVIARHQTYSVIGKNSAGTWWQVSLPGGIVGWVNGTYFTVTNGSSVPVVF
jgi:uncharacterized protein YgiM (DUF1202 family)